MKFTIPLMALIGLGIAVAGAQSLRPTPAERKPTWNPTVPSADRPRLAGIGVVEPPGELIAIGSTHAGIVCDVPVSTGCEVAAGSVLFQLDDAEVHAEWLLKQAELRIAEAKLTRLRNLPRPEEVPGAEQRVAAGIATLAIATDRVTRAEQLSERKTIAMEEVVIRQNDFAKAKADLEYSKAELTRIKAGASADEIAVAAAEVAGAAAAVERLSIKLRKMTVRAPGDGKVYRLNVRAGEPIETGRLDEPRILFGRSGALHVRVEFDENDSALVNQATVAEGWTRGSSSARCELRLLKWEPHVRPKKSLTGSSNERVDTRVLVGVFEISSGERSPIVGQQLDVYVQIGDSGT